jgi:uncharacterized protein (DUF1499 family)
MKRQILTVIGIFVAIVVTGLLVAASIWPVINEVETGATPEYPELQPRYYNADPERVFAQSRDAIDSMPRWNVVSAESASHTIQATHETYVFGFIDDVTIWIEPVTEFVTRVRVRSASRVGQGDFGQNARNIRSFFSALDDRLGAVKFDPDQLEQGRNPKQPEKGPEDDTDTDTGN